jgi:hypothetical protein
MEHENAVLVQWSFRELLSGGDRAVEALLERLYARAPGLMHCFAPAGPFQRRRQMAALAFALKSLEDFDHAEGGGPGRAARGVRVLLDREPQQCLG